MRECKCRHMSLEEITVFEMVLTATDDHRCCFFSSKREFLRFTDGKPIEHEDLSAMSSQFR